MGKHPPARQPFPCRPLAQATNVTTRKTFLLHTIRSTPAGLKAAGVLQDPMSVLCIRQLVVEALLRDPKRFTAGEQPDSASSQCQTATQQAIPSDQPAANLFILSDEIDPSRARRHLPEPLFGISNSVSVSQATAGIITIARPGSAKIPSRSGRTNGGARRDRTDDIVLAKHALSQLSYGPLLEKTTCPPPPKPSGLTADRPGAWRMVGLGRLELPTSRLSSARSNQLSYKPKAKSSTNTAQSRRDCRERDPRRDP